MIKYNLFYHFIIIMRDKDSSIKDIKTPEIDQIDDRDKRCAPSKSFQDGSCIPLNIMIEMAKAYNKIYKDDKIKLVSTLETLNPGKYKKYLVKEFADRLNNVCDNQRCWVKQKFVKIMDDKMREELEKDTYRPKGPQGKFTWLNTFNINQVMGQYENKYKDFKFLGAVPIDFDDLPSLGIKDLNFDKLINQNKKKIGMIFNLDEHYKDGSHWVSLFADLSKGQVYFSDSYGIEPEPRIRKFMRRVARYIRDRGENVDGKDGGGSGDSGGSGKKLDVQHNKHRHQHGNNACGVYSINFILRLLQGETFDKITKNKVSDSEVNKCRLVYFT